MCENCNGNRVALLKVTAGQVPTQVACPCPPSRLERFAEPCLLLSIAEESAHGYQLIEKLARFGLQELAPDPTLIYRTLRRMEQEGLVTSKWVPSESGPAKRLYHLTPEGEELLHAWVITIRKNRGALGRFLRLYTRRFAGVLSKAR